MLPEYKIVEAKYKLIDFINNEIHTVNGSLDYSDGEIYISSPTKFQLNFRQFLEELYEELSRIS